MLSLGKRRLKSPRAITTHPLEWLRFKTLSTRKSQVLLAAVSRGPPENAEQFLVMIFPRLAHNFTPKYLHERSESMSPHRLANKCLQKLHAKWPHTRDDPTKGWPDKRQQDERVRVSGRTERFQETTGVLQSNQGAAREALGGVPSALPPVPNTGK